MGYKTYTCPIARMCGGCEWLAVPYAIQLRRKQEWIASVFANVIKQDCSQLDEIAGMQGEPTHFRHKAATPFAPGTQENVRYGFYAYGTHHIIPCQACLAENPQARKIFNKLARVAEEWHIPAYNEDQGTGVLRHAIVRIGWKTNECLLVIVTSHCDFRHKKEFFYALRKTCPEVTSAVQNINDRKTNAMLGRQSYVVWGTGTMHDKLLGCLFEIGPQSFYQTNPAQTEALYQRAIEATGLRERSRLLDAYCGTGTIGICAASALKRHKQTIQVVGIDQTPDAIACARRNARINALQTSCRFVRTDATAYIKAACRGNTSSHFDAVILDPPRAGSTPDFLESVSLLAPQRVIYVSCNVKTQLRDLDILRARGYRVTRILPVDMFPHTKHVECIAALSHVRAEG